MALRSSTNPLEISKEDRSAEEMVGNQASRRRKREQMSYRGRAQYFRRDKRERMAWWRHGGCALLSGGRDKETDFKGFFGRVNVHPLSVWPIVSPPPPSFHSLSLFLCFTRSRRRNPASTDETFHFHSQTCSSKRWKHLSQIIEHGVVSDLAEPLSENNRRILRLLERWMRYFWLIIRIFLVPESFTSDNEDCTCIR